jgi:hypothetical protein
MKIILMKNGFQKTSKNTTQNGLKVNTEKRFAVFEKNLYSQNKIWRCSKSVDTHKSGFYYPASQLLKYHSTVVTSQIPPPTPSTKSSSSYYILHTAAKQAVKLKI